MFTTYVKRLIPNALHRPSSCVETTSLRALRNVCAATLMTPGRGSTKLARTCFVMLVGPFGLALPALTSGHLSGPLTPQLLTGAAVAPPYTGPCTGSLVCPVSPVVARLVANWRGPFSSIRGTLWHQPRKTNVLLRIKTWGPVILGSHKYFGGNRQVAETCGNFAVPSESVAPNWRLSRTFRSAGRRQRGRLPARSDQRRSPTEVPRSPVNKPGG